MPFNFIILYKVTIWLTQCYKSFMVSAIVDGYECAHLSCFVIYIELTKYRFFSLVFRKSLKSENHSEAEVRSTSTTLNKWQDLEHVSCFFTQSILHWMAFRGLQFYNVTTMRSFARLQREHFFLAGKSPTILYFRDKTFTYHFGFISVLIYVQFDWRNNVFEFCSIFQ